MCKTFVITGASRGIGRACAIGLAAPGNNIVISCKNNSNLLDEVKAEIIKKGAKCLSYVGDMGSFEDVQEMFELILETFGNIDVLINNAGISTIGLFQDMTPAEWKSIMSANLDSVYNCCHFAVKDMIKRHSGKIINISSIWGVHGASCEVAYSSTKGAVNSFTKALAKELAPSNIQVNAIACGAIATDMNNHLSNDEKAAIKEEIPAGRFGDPQEVYELVNSLVNMNGYLTGQIIGLDGAWY